MREVESWPVTFMAMAHTMAKRSLDPSTQCGSCIVGEGKRVLGLGYNGPPPQMDDSLVDWYERDKKLPLIIHSEVNAIYDAIDKCGSKALHGATLYVTGHPCSGCLLHIIRSGISEVVWDDTVPQPKMCDEADREKCWLIRSKLKDASGFKVIGFSGVKWR